MHQFGAGGGQGGAEGGDAVTAEGVVLGEGGDHHAGLADGERVGDGVLRGIAVDAEDIAVPFVAGDAVGDGAVDDQEFLVFERDRQHCEGDSAGGAADSEVHVLIAIGLGEQVAGDVGLGLAVFFDQLDFAAGDGVGAVGGVFQAELEADGELLGVGLERTGAVGDQRHTDGRGRLCADRRGEDGWCDGREQCEGQPEAGAHDEVLINPA